MVISYIEWVIVVNLPQMMSAANNITVLQRTIIAMGRFASQALLRSTESIAELRGQKHEYLNGHNLTHIKDGDPIGPPFCTEFRCGSF